MTTVFWITGYSGAGKTTVARALQSALARSGRAGVLLDGDALRAILGEELMHSLDDRRRLAMRYARLCREIAGQGVDVICATISMFHDVQRWNRANIPGYVEIYLQVPQDVREARDPKGLYARARRGEEPDMIGFNRAAEEPEAPDLIIDNSRGGVEDAVERILSLDPLHARHLRKLAP